MAERVILASASTSRAHLLAAAGVAAQVQPSSFDEAALKRRLAAEGAAAGACALALAEGKAQQVAACAGDALVIGADQLLAVGSEWFDKPEDLAAARSQLRALRGRSHELATAACVVRAGTVLWQSVSVSRLAMRAFSDAFLDAYLAAEGAAVLGSVGAYRLEGRGAQLFERVEGDYFAILGLPLIELLGFLRARGALAD